ELVRGADYTWNFFLNHWLLVVLAMAGLVVTAAQFWILDFGFWRRKAVQNPKSKIQNPSANLSVALALLVIVYQLYIIVEGGDWANANRFFVPIAAPFALL